MRRHRLLLLLSILLAGCSTPGAFFGALDGEAFAPLVGDAEQALVYVYRPRTAWADQELEAPGLFLDHQPIGSLPSNGFLALALEAGTYQLEMRRPLFGSFWTLLAEGPVDFSRIISFALEVEAGSLHYLRYDELDPPPLNEVLTVASEGPLQRVSADLAQGELPATRQVQPLARIARRETRVRAQQGFWRGVGRALNRVGS
ncbi:MAG: DUF2846 domain-containing protein [Pseudomonadota bacterium]